MNVGLTDPSQEPVSPKTPDHVAPEVSPEHLRGTSFSPVPAALAVGGARPQPDSWASRPSRPAPHRTEAFHDH